MIKQATLYVSGYEYDVSVVLGQRIKELEDQQMKVVHLAVSTVHVPLKGIWTTVVIIGESRA